MDDLKNESTFIEKALRQFFLKSAKLGEDHNYYVNLEIDDNYQAVAVIDLIIQAQYEVIKSTLKERDTQVVEANNTIEELKELLKLDQEFRDYMNTGFKKGISNKEEEALNNMMHRRAELKSKYTKEVA